MKNQIRIYSSSPLSLSSEMTLNREESHYLHHVMRLKKGYLFRIFNENDGEFMAKILQADRHGVRIQIKEFYAEAYQPAYRLQLNFSPLKKHAMDMFIPKAVELGITHFQPMMTEYTQRNLLKMDRIELQIKEAMEQCERMDRPIWKEVKDFSALLGELNEGVFAIYGDEATGGAPIHDVFSLASDKNIYHIFIGAEGGFSEEEHEMMKENPFCHGVSLGPRILRAETAAIASLTAFQIYAGDWNLKPRQHISKKDNS